VKDKYTLVHEGLSQWINSPNNGGDCCQTWADTVDELNRLLARIKRLEDCAETAWGIIANVDSGSWQEQRADWREAATRWRDEQFHPELSEHKAKEAKP